MATNRELREVASALSKELGVDASTDGLNNEKLAALVTSLEAIKAERQRTETKTDPPPGDEAATSPVVEAMRERAQRETRASNQEAAAALQAEVKDGKPSRWGYRIKKGYALYCAKGLLREHSEVNPRDFTTSDFQRHRNEGAIVETKLSPPKKKK